MIFAADIASAVSKEECLQLAWLATDIDVLEMGSYLGRSTIALASTARMVYAVDHWEGDAHVGRGDFYNGFVTNLERYNVAHKVMPYQGNFEDVVPSLALEGRQFPLIFLDGQHDKASVERDTALALTVLEEGGVMTFHDYGSIYPIHEVVDTLGGDLHLVRTLAVVRGLK